MTVLVTMRTHYMPIYKQSHSNVKADRGMRICQYCRTGGYQPIVMTCGVTVETFGPNGKTIIQNYIGKYQITIPMLTQQMTLVNTL